MWQDSLEAIVFVSRALPEKELVINENTICLQQLSSVQVRGFLVFDNLETTALRIEEYHKRA